MQDIIALVSAEFAELLTPVGMFALFNIIFIDVIMSGDNALLIGMATKNLPMKDRKRAIFWGVVLATILRVVFALFAVYLLGIIGVRLAGGLLLLYVVYKLYREIRHEMAPKSEKNAIPTTLKAAITSIIIADFSMSLDNVLAVAGASHGNVVALGIGLVISIVLMAVASNFMAVLLQKHPNVQWLGLIVLLYVAGHMVYTGGTEVFATMVH
jgi:YjbE family integral membrane protein